jgi:hypothetical protein
MLGWCENSEQIGGSNRQNGVALPAKSQAQTVSELADLDTRCSGALLGIAASPGIARGPAFLCLCGQDLAVPRREVSDKELPAQMERLEAAIRDAETTPLRDPGRYQYDLSLVDVTEVWRRGSVIVSWLLDLTASALAADPRLTKFAGRVSDSGGDRWTIKAAINEGVPVPVLTTALYERFASRGEADYQDKLLSAMRFGFGGHLEKEADRKP